MPKSNTLNDNHLIHCRQSPTKWY